MVLITAQQGVARPDWGRREVRTITPGPHPHLGKLGWRHVLPMCVLFSPPAVGVWVRVVVWVMVWVGGYWVVSGDMAVSMFNRFINTLWSYKAWYLQGACPVINCLSPRSWMGTQRWSTSVGSSVPPSGEVSEHSKENAWKEWPEIWHAVSWPLSEVIRFWSVLARFRSYCGQNTQ